MKTDNELTDIGFKRMVNKKFELQDGYIRKFLRCPKCKNKTFRDYVPYSLSGGVITVPCGHEFRNLKEF